MRKDIGFIWFLLESLKQRSVYSVHINYYWFTLFSIKQYVINTLLVSLVLMCDTTAQRQWCISKLTSFSWGECKVRVTEKFATVSPVMSNFSHLSLLIVHVWCLCCQFRSHKEKSCCHAAFRKDLCVCAGLCDEQSDRTVSSVSLPWRLI